MKIMKPLRIIVFGSAYFLLFLLSVLIHLIEVALHNYPVEFWYYMQHPFKLLLMVVSEVLDNPLPIMALLFQLVSISLALGFATEWVYGFIKKRRR